MTLAPPGSLLRDRASRQPVATECCSHTSVQWLWRPSGPALQGHEFAPLLLNPMVVRRGLVGGQWLLSAVCLLPFAHLVWRIFGGDLGPDPGRELALVTGLWGFRLLLCLAITPLRILSGRAGLLRYRRTVGLFAWFYLSLYFVCWVSFLLQWRFGQLATELLERPFITVGFTGWLLLLPLGLTSTRVMQRRLGRRWKQLHRLIYVIAILGSLHFLWLSKDYYQPLVYTSILLLLLGFRLIQARWWHRSGQRAS